MKRRTPEFQPCYLDIKCMLPCMAGMRTWSLWGGSGRPGWRAFSLWLRPASRVKCFWLTAFHHFPRTLSQESTLQKYLIWVFGKEWFHPQSNHYFLTWTHCVAFYSLQGKWHLGYEWRPRRVSSEERWAWTAQPPGERAHCHLTSCPRSKCHLQILTS